MRMRIGKRINVAIGKPGIYSPNRRLDMLISSISS